MADDVKIGIGAEDTGFGAALGSAKLQSQEAAEKIKLSFESINDTFAKVRTAFLAFTAVLAGGEAFKEMISSTVAATVSSIALGRQLGISATDASQLKVAMDSVFVSQDQMSGANQKITMALKKNESAFTDLGVATRDSNGDFRNALDIQMDVNAALMQFTEGTDRNVEGVKIYGKGWLEAQNTLRLTPAVLEEARVKADELGLTVGQENVAAVKRYRTAMVDVHDIVEGFDRVVGDQMLPLLADLGEWFGARGPDSIGVFRAAMLGITIVIDEIVGGLKIVVDLVGGAFKQLIAVSKTFGDYFIKMVQLDFTGAGDALSAGWKQYQTAGTGAISAVEKDWADAQGKMTDAFDRAFSHMQTGIPKPKTGLKSDGTDEKKARLMSDLAGELEAKKAAWATEQAAHGTFIQFSLEQEQKFWEENSGRAKAGSNDAIAIQRNIDKLSVDMAKEKYKESIAKLKEEEAAYKNNLQAKLAIAKEMAAKIALAEGGSSPQARAAGAAVITIEREIKAQQLAIDEAYVKSANALELSQIDAAEREAVLENQLGKTTNEELLAQEAQFENQRYQLHLLALQNKMKLLAQDPTENVAKIATTNQEILALQIQHNAQMDKLRIKSVADANKDWRGLFGAMQSGFQSTITEFLSGTTTLAGTVKSLFKNIADAIIGVIAQMTVEWAVMQLKTLILGKATAISQITANAGIAATAAMASVAAIPFYGWAMAGPTGAATFAEAMTYSASAAAERGYDIPAGINPIVQTHAREMILPSKHADVIRGLADNGSESKGGGGFNPTIQVSAMDGPSFVKWMNQNAGPVAASLKNLNNRFMTTTNG